MAILKSDAIVRKEQIAISNKAEASNLTGKLPLIETVSYTLTGSEAANDTIQLMDLPVGAVVIPDLCSVTSADPGTTLTLDIGDAADVDRYADDIVLNAGGRVGFNSTLPVPAGITTPYLTVATSRVFATVKTAAALTAAVKLNFLIAYRIKG